MVQLQDVPPAKIESESFAIIESEFEAQTGKAVSEIEPDKFKVIQRIIHATGDFSIANDIVFQHDVLNKAIGNIQAGMNILTDVTMAASGVSSTILAKFGGKVICRVAEKETAEYATREGLTRSEAAIARSLDDNVGVIAIGNAPTALIAAIRLITSGHFPDAVIIGVPVGFVNAAESKEMLKESNIPAIVLTGRRGGSPIAVAAVNAILRMA